MGPWYPMAGPTARPDTDISVSFYYFIVRNFDISFEGFDSEPLSGEGTNDAEPESSPTDGRKRKLQQVSTIQARIKVVKWMVEDEKENGK